MFVVRRVEYRLSELYKLHVADTAARQTKHETGCIHMGRSEVTQAGLICLDCGLVLTTCIVDYRLSNHIIVSQGMRPNRRAAPPYVAPPSKRQKTTPAGDDDADGERMAPMAQQTPQQPQQQQLPGSLHAVVKKHMAKINNRILHLGIVLRTNDLFVRAIADVRFKSWFKTEATCIIHGNKGQGLVLACLQQALDEAGSTSGQNVESMLITATMKGSAMAACIQKSRFFVLMVCKAANAAAAAAAGHHS